MLAAEIRSIGSLENHDGTICLTLCTQANNRPVFVSVPKQDLQKAGGIEAIKDNKQLAVNFLNKYGAGRP